MICPSCESEYRDGFTRCADCDVDLVNVLPEPELPRVLGLKQTDDPALVASLAEALESATIGYVVEAGTALEIADDEDVPDTPRPWRARIWVIAGQFDRAAAIVDEVEAALAKPAH
jgi:hypothetical protein